MRQYFIKNKPEKKIEEILHVVKAMKKNKSKVKNNILMIDKYAPGALNLINLSLTSILVQVC